MLSRWGRYARLYRHSGNDLAAYKGCYTQGRFKVLDKELVAMVEIEVARGKAKWGAIDKSPDILLNAAVEELGEVAHAINHDEGPEKAAQEIAETIGVLSRLFEMVAPPSPICLTDEP